MKGGESLALKPLFSLGRTTLYCVKDGEEERGTNGEPSAQLRGE